MKKAIIVATVCGFFEFLKNDIGQLKKMGYEVHLAGDFQNMSGRMKEFVDEEKLVVHQIDFKRSPFSIQTFRAYRQLKKVVSSEKYSLIHCHTPVGGILGRLAAKKYRRHGVKVLYTAHGFHFYGGAPFKNWLLYYPAEWFCSFFTDVLVTINREDYRRAKKRFHAKRTEYIPGVGIDLQKFQFSPFEAEEKRRELDVKPDETMLLSVGELNSNKNHEIVIRALHILNNPKIKYFIAGKGELKEYLEDLVNELGLEKQVQMLGFRTDIVQLDCAADFFMFPSKREGLGLAAIEAMACKRPVLGMNTRGIREYVRDGKTGFLMRDDPKDCARCIERALKMTEAQKDRAGKQCVKQAEKYDRKNAEKIMRHIYHDMS